MNEREIIEQLESLIEAWQLDEADLNQTDINAIKGMLDKNKKLKNQLEASEKAIKEARELIKSKQYVIDFSTFGYGLNNYEIFKLKNILDIDKGE